MQIPQSRSYEVVLVNVAVHDTFTPCDFPESDALVPEMAPLNEVPFAHVTVTEQPVCDTTHDVSRHAPVCDHVPA